MIPPFGSRTVFIFQRSQFFDNSKCFVKHNNQVIIQKKKHNNQVIMILENHFHFPLVYNSIEMLTIQQTNMKMSAINSIVHMFY